MPVWPAPFRARDILDALPGAPLRSASALPPSTMVQAFGLTAVRGQRETVVTGKLSLAWKWHLLPAPHTAVFAEYLQRRCPQERQNNMALRDL